MLSTYDVFLSHKSHDKPAVEKVGAWLRSKGLSVWLDKWELRPGLPWQEGLEEGVRASKGVAVFVGRDGLGFWQEPEMRAFIDRSRRETVPVIPVLLPGCPGSTELSLFLKAYTWVDLREGISEEGLTRLLWGITGEKSLGLGGGDVAWGRTGAPQDRQPEPPAEGRSQGLLYGVLVLLAVVGVAIAGGLLPRKVATAPVVPPIYALRVQVLDPEGHLIDGGKVRVSSGNEALRVSEGGWEIQIPAAKVPKDGRISLWAEHEAWEGREVEVRLADDANPRVQVRLKPPLTWLRGRVVDEEGHGVAQVRISRQNGGAGQAVSEGDGRFELKLAVPRDIRVGLRAERAGWAVKEVFCYAGSDSCPILLER